MPELPEVETVRIGLHRLIIGKQILSVDSDWPKSFPNSKSDVDTFLLQAKVLDVRRRAKVLLIDLSSRYSLVIHLKMTGQLVFVPKSRELRATSHEQKATSNNSSRDSELTTRDSTEERFGAGHPNESLIGKLPDKSTRVTLAFRDGSHLFFNDQRKFGWVRLIPTNQIEELDFFKKVGPEPLDSSFTAAEFSKRVARRKNTSIKAALLDQTVLAGVGNIYADESLWGAKIHPATKVSEISHKELSILFDELIYVLRLSIEKGGSTDRNYVNAEGKKGSYIQFARVFRREGKTCPRCGDTIIKTRVAGRGTHLCPTCQRKNND